MPEAAPASVTPPPIVRVRTETLDRFLSSVGEVVLASSQLRTSADAHGLAPTAEVAGGFDRMDRVVGELQRRAMSLRTTPLLRVIENLPRVAADLARRLGKQVEVEIQGAELELDRAILDRLADPLAHLIRNAVDHGIESPEQRRAAGKAAAGAIEIRARRERDSIQILVEDDGAGIDLARLRERAVAAGLLLPDLAEDLPPEEIASLVFRSGLSTADVVSDISGRGVGMDAVRATIESLGGVVEIATREGQGTCTVLTVPITAAVQNVVLVTLGEETVALPIAKVERLLELPARAIEDAGGECFALVDDDPVLVLDLARCLGWGACQPREPESGREVPLVLADVRGQPVALRVDRLAGQQQIYVKPVPELLAHLRVLAGLTLLGDGRPVFVVDVNQLA